MSTDRNGHGAPAPAEKPIDKWHQRHAGAIIGASVAIVIFVMGTAWNVRRDDLRALDVAKAAADQKQAELVESVRRVTSSVERLTEMAIENRTKNESQDTMLGRGRDDRLASERMQDGRMNGIDTKLAVIATEQKQTNETIQRVLRKVEEVGRKDDRPFDQGLREAEGRFPFILKANGTVSRLKLRADLL